MVDWTPGRGSEQTGRRPSVVIQANAYNRQGRYPNTVVLAVSRRGLDVISHVRLEPAKENGLTATSYVKCEQILTVSKQCLESRLGTLTEDELAQVETGLSSVVGLLTSDSFR